jgi:Na+/H+ antiporter NhaC
MIMKTSLPKYFCVYLIVQVLFFWQLATRAGAETERRFTLESPGLAIQGVRSSKLVILAEEKTPDGWKVDKSYSGVPKIDGIVSLDRDKTIKPVIEQGTISISNVAFTNNIIKIKDSNWANSESSVFFIPGILSILPPLIAIVLSMIFRNVLIALFSGIWFGVTIINQYNPFSAFLRSFDKYILEALADKSHASIILFSIGLGGMIGIIIASGGIKAIVNFLIRYANTIKKGQFTTWLLGILIFFDDYASALLVGHMMRPYSDKLRISREKLSFIVDSTAAPIAGMAVISTWVSFEMGQIDGSMSLLGNVKYNAYDLLISSLPYNFYCIFLIIFVLMIALTGRDFGPMLKAERRALNEGKVIADGSTPMFDDSLNPDVHNPEKEPNALNAIVPILSVILITVIGIIYTGLEKLGIDFSSLNSANLRDVIGASSTNRVLLWAVFGSSLIAGIMVIATNALTLEKVVNSWVSGVKSIIFALLILTLAWTLAAVCNDLNTKYYIISAIGNTIPLWIFPTVVFILASITSFATGTSYGTMGILFPLVIPLIFTLIGDTGTAAVDGTNYHPVFLAIIGSVIAGAIFGDHTSPISDTTVMSAMSTGSDLIDHVRTQLVYGIFINIFAILIGFLPTSFGISPWICLIAGIPLLYIALMVFGKRVDTGS